MTFILTALVVTAQAADDISLLQTLSTHRADKVAQRGDEKSYPLPILLEKDEDDEDGKKGKDDKDDEDGKKGKDDKDDKDGKKGKDDDKKDKDKKDEDKDKEKDHDDHVDEDDKDGKKGKDDHADHDDHDDKDDKDGKKGKDYKDFYKKDWYKDWYKDKDVDEPDHPTRPPDHPTRPPSHPTRPPVAAAAARAGPSQPASPECVFEAYSKSEGKWFRLERLRATRECTSGRAEEIKGYDACIYDLQDQLREARFVRTDGMCERTILKQDCEEEEGPEEKGKGKKGKKKKLDDKDFIMKKVESRYLPIGIGHRVCQIVIVPSKAKKDKKDKK